jgi:ectoine hydroxylase-related dioxygenase (phytanoyl-CoA dioxygenase family)
MNQIAPTLNQLDQKGYTIVPDLLGEDQVAEVKDWVARIIACGNDAPKSLEPQFECTDPTSLRKIRRLFWHDMPFWMDQFRRGKLREFVRESIGEDAALIFHAAFLKPAGVGSAIEPHQDQALWPQPYPSAISVWVALEAATLENGCLEIYEETHRMGDLPHNDGVWHACVDISSFRKTSIPLASGDAVAWHRLMVHGSAANLSDKPRWGMVMVFARESEPGFDAFDRYPLKLL